MRVVLEAVEGVAQGVRFEYASPGSMRVGRALWASPSFPEDPNLAGIHFALTAAPFGARLHDLTGGATRLNGNRFADALLCNGDRVEAGSTTWKVQIEGGPPEADAQDEPLRSPMRARVLDLLRGANEPLFALVDAARDPQAWESVCACPDLWESVFTGTEAATLAEVAPYLVRVPPESRWLPTLVGQGWGQGWGVFLTCASGFTELLAHLRRWLVVLDPHGLPSRFRFYDPRVLGPILPTLSAAESRELSGPITRWLLEADTGSMLLDVRLRAGLQVRRTHLLAES